MGGWQEKRILCWTEELTSTNGTNYTIGQTSPGELKLSRDRTALRTYPRWPEDIDPIKQYELSKGSVRVKPTPRSGYNPISSDLTVKALNSKLVSGGVIQKNSKTYYFDEKKDGGEYCNYEKMPFEIIRKIINYGAVIEGNVELYSGNGQANLYLEYRSPYYIKSKRPISGETRKSKEPITFNWDVYIPGPESQNPPYEYVSKSPRSFKFIWRVKGTIQENEVECGEKKTITIPGETWNAGQIEWKISGLMQNSMAIRESENMDQEWAVLNISGPDPQSTAHIIRPKDTIITTQEPVEFVWEHVIATGTEQTKAELQKSRNGSSYTAMATIQGAGNTYTLPPNSIEPGAFWWRVRTYNTEGLAGFWSEPARLSVIGKPKAPAVSMQRVSPRPEIKWTSEVQEAYEVKITNADGIVEKRQRFGTEKLYKTEKYLEDGTYTASVRVQNIYGYWSDWASTSFTVKNVPGPAIRLTAAGVNIVNLSWTGRSGATFLVYRNGNLIARTTNKTYKDQFAAGEVEYQVRGIADTTGNYAVSNKVGITVKIDHMQVADVNKPVWLDLGRSINELRTTSNPTRQSVAYSHFAGQALPSAEIGEYTDKSYSFDVAWRAKDRAAIEAFEALTGHLVCIKTITGRAIFGILNDVDTKENKLVASSTATITVVEWQEAGI